MYLGRARKRSTSSPERCSGHWSTWRARPRSGSSSTASTSSPTSPARRWARRSRSPEATCAWSSPRGPTRPVAHRGTLHYGRTPRDDLDRYLASRRVRTRARRPSSTGPGVTGSSPAAGRCRPERSGDRPRPTAGHGERSLRGSCLTRPGPPTPGNEVPPGARPTGRRRDGPDPAAPVARHASRRWAGRQRPGGRPRRPRRPPRSGRAPGCGQADEHVGLFHPTLAEYLLSSSAARPASRSMPRRRTGPDRGHRGPGPIAPGTSADDPLHRYAFLREADHLWALGDIDRTPRRACSKRDRTPRGRTSSAGGSGWPGSETGLTRPSEHPELRPGRVWTGQAGDARRRCDCSRAAAGPGARLGRDHPTRSPPAITSRTGPARWVTPGRRCDCSGTAAGPGASAGPRPPHTLKTRNNIARLTGEVGDAGGGVEALPRAAAGPGAGAGPRPPRHAHYPPRHRGSLTGRRAMPERHCGGFTRVASGPGADAGSRPPRHHHQSL